MRFFIGAVAALTASLPALAQKPATASQAFEHVQRTRDQARPLWKQGQEKGIQMLEEVLRFLDDPTVLDLAQGDFSLRTRRQNVYYDLAAAHAVAGRKQEAFGYLQRLAGEGSPGAYLPFVEKEPAFDGLRQEAGYRRALATLKTWGRVWASPALETPYRDNISAAEKIAGLSRFWAEVKFNFVYFDRVPDLDWDRLYLEYLSGVTQTASTKDYYRLLQELCARLKDGHTNVDPPKELADQLYRKPPLRTGLVEGKVLILEVLSQTLSEQGLQAGQEILSIDGIPVQQYAQQQVAPYASSSTPQDLELRTYTYGLLNGPAKQPVWLAIEDAKGDRLEKNLPREGYQAVRGLPRFEVKTLPGNVAHVALNDFSDHGQVKLFEAALESLARSAALILDLRRNGGGDSSVGYRILGHLTDRPFLTSRERMRNYVPTLRAQGLDLEWRTDPAEAFPPSGKTPYTKPVAVLISAATFSAAEDFCVAFDGMKRGKMIGEPTGGSTGQPLFFRLPGGGSARVCTKRDTYPDGREFVGVGVQPDILARPTVQDVRAGRDRVLEAALRYLQ